MRFTDLLFAFAIVYLPYEAHYPLVLDVKGVNALNMIIVVLLVVILVRRERAPSPTPLKGRFLFFFAALTIAFLIGESYDSWTFADDLTVLKDMVMYASLYFIYYHGARDERSVRVLYAAVMLTLTVVVVSAQILAGSGVIDGQAVMTSKDSNASLAALPAASPAAV